MTPADKQRHDPPSGPAPATHCRGSIGHVPRAMEAEQRQHLSRWLGLAFSLVFGAVALLVLWNLLNPLARDIAAGLWPNAVLKAMLCLLALAVLLAAKADFRLRAAAGLVCLYAMAALQLGQAGPLGPGVIWLFATPVVAAVFSGLRGVLATLVINGAILAWTIHAAAHGLAAWPGVFEFTPAQWLRFAGQFMILNAVASVGPAFMLRSREKALAQQLAAASALLSDREELQKTQWRLSQSELRFRMLAENAVDMIWSMDMELNYTYVSPAVLGLTGRSAQEAMARPLKEQAPPEAYAQLKKYFDEALSRGKATGDWRVLQQFDLPLRHQNGSTVWVSVNAAFVLDETGRAVGVHGVSRDITQRKLAELELKRKSLELAKASEELERTRQVIQTSRNKLKAIFDGLHDPIISLTPAGNIESLNMAAARLTNRHPRELVGLPAGEMLALTSLPQEVADATMAAFNQTLATGGHQWRLVRVPGEDGPLFHEINVTPAIDDEGKLALGIVHYDDVTEFKRMELQIRKYNDELEHMVAERTAELTQAHADLKGERDRLSAVNLELKRLEQLRHDLTNMVVHDMKGPLAELMGNLDLMHYDLDKAQMAETLDMAEMGGQDLLRMIMNLLDIGRLEENRLMARKQPTPFGQLATGVRDKFKTLIRLKGLDVRVADQTTADAALDPDLMERVLQNLLTNALQHTERGHIELAARTADDGQTIISVSDTGGGIPAAAHGLIFKKFVQANENGGPRTSTGLGLTFCKLAVEAHGGEIWFESQEGQGATFYIRLPAEDADVGGAPA